MTTETPEAIAAEAVRALVMQEMQQSCSDCSSLIATTAMSFPSECEDAATMIRAAAVILTQVGIRQMGTYLPREKWPDVEGFDPLLPVVTGVTMAATQVALGLADAFLSSVRQRSVPSLTMRGVAGHA